jgi:uncharacterized protein YkwD
MADAGLANWGDMPEGRRRMWKYRQLAAMLSLTAAVCVLAPSAPAVAAARSVERHELLQRTNGSRDAFSRADVAINRSISRLVKRHSSWMARTGNFEHTKHPAAEYLKGVAWHCWGENIAMSSGSMRDVEKAFMHSPEHRANILDPCFKHVAIGVVRDGDGIAWVTVFFYG